MRFVWGIIVCAALALGASDTKAAETVQSAADWAARCRRSEAAHGYCANLLLISIRVGSKDECRNAIPNDADFPKVTDAVLAWIDMHPDQQRDPFDDVVNEAVKALFGCEDP